MARMAIAAFAAILLGSPALAQTGQITSQPYQLRIALRVAKHPLLTGTPIFKNRLLRELHDGPQSALGAMGQVEVLDMSRPEVVERSPILKEVESKGLRQGLDGWLKVSEFKTHFVFVDFIDGAYEIQSRQHDGPTGLASPVVRHFRTTDRELIGRAAALMVDQDFGIVGAVAGAAAGDVRSVEIMGGALTGSLEHWVKKGDVFLISQVREGSGGRQALRVDWAVLQALEAPANGVVKCAFHHRYENPLQTGPGVVGYRCLKVATSGETLRMRFVQFDRPLQPIVSKQIKVGTQGLDGAMKQELVTDSDGQIESKQNYRGVAFVQVVEGNTIFAKIPVAIFDDRIVVCPVNINPGAEQRSQLELRKQDWLKKVYEQSTVQALLITELNALLGRSKEDALKRAQSAQSTLKSGYENLSLELTTLRDAYKKTPGANAQDLADGEQRLQDMQQQRESLVKFEKNLVEALKQENDPKVKELLNKKNQAELLEEAANYDKAIELYQQVLAEQKDNAALAAYVDKLKAAWAIKSEKHRQARAFVYTAWPKVPDASQINAYLGDARNALSACKEAGDQLTPRMMQIANVAHAAKIQKESSAIDPTNEDAKSAAKNLEQAASGLDALIKDVNAYLQSAPARK